MKRDVSREAFQAEIKRLSLASTLGKPEALSGPVLTIRMIETIVQSAAQAAANRAAAEALSQDIKRLRYAVRRKEQNWLRPVLYGLGGAITGGGLVAFIMIKWLAGHY